MKRHHGFTRVELLSLVVVLVVVGFLAVAVILPSFSIGHRRTHHQPFRCINNLRQVALAELLFINDHDLQVTSWMVSTNQGGSREYRDSSDVWRHFQVLSNELPVPKVLHCPADKDPKPAEDWATLRNDNVSYFVNLNGICSTNANIAAATMLFGDRLLGYQHKGETTLLITADRPVSWKPQIHSRQGCVAFADGSVQWFTTKKLQQFIQFADTRRLQTTNPPPLLALP